MKERIAERKLFNINMAEEKHRKIIFFSLIAISFFAILIYNVFTPAMTDDLIYKRQCRKPILFLI